MSSKTRRGDGKTSDVTSTMEDLKRRALLLSHNENRVEVNRGTKFSQGKKKGSLRMGVKKTNYSVDCRGGCTDNLEVEESTSSYVNLSNL